MVAVKVVGPPSPSAAGGAKLPASSSLAHPHTSTRRSPPARSRVPFQANHVPPAPDVAPLHETMSGPIASAVVLPEPDDAPPPAASPSNALKRRQSSVADDAPGDSAKRARTNGDDANNDIAEVSVVGVPDVRYGEAVAAFVIPRDHGSKTLTAEDIQQWVRDKLSNHLSKS